MKTLYFLALLPLLGACGEPVPKGSGTIQETKEDRYYFKPAIFVDEKTGCEYIGNPFGVNAAYLSPRYTKSGTASGPGQVNCDPSLIKSK